MAGLETKVRGYANELLGRATELVGKVVGSSSLERRGAVREDRGENQVEWGKAKERAGNESRDPDNER